MELKLGFMSNAELAEWFGIKPDSFSKKKKAYIEKLEAHADITVVRGGVEIFDIHVPHYDKSLMHKEGAYEKIRDEIDEVWNDNGLDTGKNVAIKIQKKIGNELTVQPATIYNYTLKGERELYGVYFSKGGTIGNRIYVMCKSTDDGYALFNEEEERIKQNLLEKYYGTSITEKWLIAKQMVEAGEIEEKDVYAMVENMQTPADIIKRNKKDNKDLYSLFMTDLQTALGCKVERVTKKMLYPQIESDDFAF